MKKITAVSVPNKVRQWAAQVIKAAQGLITPFSVNGYSVNPGDFPEVAQALHEQSIWLGYLPEGTDFHAGYQSGGWMLIERRTAKAKLIRTQAHLVHESIHAAFDLRGSARPFEMSTFADEACAYTAEAMYLKRQGVLPSEVLDHKPLAIGWKAAESIRSSGSVSKIIINESNAALTAYGYTNTPRIKAGIK